MKDLIFKYPDFKITTPFGIDRDIKLSVEFKDLEFKVWRTGLHKNIPTLFLITHEDQILRFKYFRGKFEAMDSRGGVSVLIPLSNAVGEWDEWAKTPTTDPFVSKVEQSIKINKNASQAIVGAYEMEGFDTYNELSKDKYETLETLFSAGYEKVFYLNFDLHSTSGIRLLENMSKLLGNSVDGKYNIGVVQAVSDYEGLTLESENVQILEADPAELFVYNGELYNFVISSKIWNSIKNIVKQHNNFDFGLSQALDKNNYVRLAPTLSRDKKSTPQDARRVNFKITL